MGRVTPDANGLWQVPLQPTMDDWVLVLEDRDALGVYEKATSKSH